MEINKHLVYLTPRHLRQMFFVDSKIPIETLITLMRNNQRLWGGRHNPIIPTYDGKIPESYLPLIAAFDPDYVFHAPTVKIESVKRIVNPKNYWESVEENFRIEGLDATYLIEPSSEELLFENGFLYKSKIKDILSFYNLNFGFNNYSPYLHTVLASSSKKLIEDSNVYKLNEILAYENILYNSSLSKRNINTSILNTDINLNSRFELIVADDENQFEDLIYYWNRQLYFDENIHALNQIYLTRNQIRYLVNDDGFHALLSSLSGIRDVFVSSISIPNTNIEELVKTHLNVSSARIKTKVLPSLEFPFDIIKVDKSNYSKQQTPDKQIVLDNKGLIKLPTVTLSQIKNHGEVWAVDLLLEDKSVLDVRRNKIKLPYRTSVGILAKHQGRINKEYDASFFIKAEELFLELTIPQEFEIIKSLLWGYEENNNYVSTSIEYLEFSDAGMKMLSFFKLFDKNWDTIKEFITNKFWLQIFKSESDFYKKNQSNIPSSKGILSYKDLLKELQLIYSNYGKNGINKIDALTEDCIKGELQYLVDREGFFIGIKIKCKNCGSNKWYSFKELDAKTICKGCNHLNTSKVQSELYYKLSDVIVGNILNDSYKDTKNFNGNYTVLNALLRIKNDGKNCKSSFLFCPPIEYWAKKGQNSDIDILAIQDGRFILGEAKNDAKEFNNSEIDKLVWLGNNLSPDKIILAYTFGEVDKNKLLQIKEKLKNKNCEVLTMKTSTSFYRLHGVKMIP